MPNWLIEFIVAQLAKEITPENVAKLEAWAAELICCKLAALAKTSPTGLDDVVVAQVAAVLGVDLSKCPA